MEAALIISFEYWIDCKLCVKFKLFRKKIWQKGLWALSQVPLDVKLNPTAKNAVDLAGHKCLDRKVPTLKKDGFT